MSRVTTAIYRARGALKHAKYLAEVGGDVHRFLRGSHGDDELSCHNIREELAFAAPAIERLEALLGEWLYEGRFWVANCEEDIDLCKRTYDILNEIDSKYRERRL